MQRIEDRQNSAEERSRLILSELQESKKERAEVKKEVGELKQNVGDLKRDMKKVVQILEAYVTPKPRRASKPPRIVGGGNR